jgi:hypothetical protein
MSKKLSNKKKPSNKRKTNGVKGINSTNEKSLYIDSLLASENTHISVKSKIISKYGKSLFNKNKDDIIKKLKNKSKKNGYLPEKNSNSFYSPETKKRFVIQALRMKEFEKKQRLRHIKRTSNKQSNENGFITQKDIETAIYEEKQQREFKSKNRWWHTRRKYLKN